MKRFCYVQIYNEDIADYNNSIQINGKFVQNCIYIHYKPVIFYYHCTDFQIYKKSS